MAIGNMTNVHSYHDLQSLQIHAENMNFYHNEQHVNRGVKQKPDRVQQHNKNSTFFLIAHTNNDMYKYMQKI
jgi:hypothetical protein